MYGRINAEMLSLSIGRHGDFDNAASITIIKNDKFEKKPNRRYYRRKSLSNGGMEVPTTATDSEDCAMSDFEL